jgi:hypothetical protein
MPFLSQRPWPVRPPQRRIKLGRKLHGDGAGAPNAFATQALQRRRDDGSPIDATVLVVAAIFGSYHGGLQGGRNVRQRGPVEAPPRGIHAKFVDHLSMPIEQPSLGGLVSGTHNGEGGYGGHGRDRPRCYNKRDEQQSSRSADGGGTALGHGCTSIGSFGNSPNISGA